jgi:c-di-GMP-binding flagellar brake protein YcgR
LTVPTLDDVFSQIETGKAVRVALPLLGTSEKKRLSCVYQAETPPVFLLLYVPGTLPLDEIDMNRKATVLLDIKGQNISLAADIQDKVNKQALRLIARDVISHEQMRHYFRVDINAPLVARPALRRDQEWSLSGETVDVSGSGLLAVFTEPIVEDEPVQVELILPIGNGEPIKAVAHVVRSREIGENQYQVALHFDTIDADDRDRIMACCFEIQRKHLRLKVQIKNPD